MRPYSSIGDQQIVPMNGAERDFLLDLLAKPTADFMQLVRILDHDGCLFPLQQAALMLRNTPGAAHALLMR